MIKIEDSTILNLIGKKLQISSEMIQEVYEYDAKMLVSIRSYELAQKNKLESSSQIPCNLLSMNKNYEIVWFAELPVSRMNNDGYWKVEFSNPIKAYSASSFECDIDIESGKILSWNFYK